MCLCCTGLLPTALHELPKIRSGILLGKTLRALALRKPFLQARYGRLQRLQTRVCPAQRASDLISFFLNIYQHGLRVLQLFCLRGQRILVTPELCRGPHCLITSLLRTFFGSPFRGPCRSRKCFLIV